MSNNSIENLCEQLAVYQLKASSALTAIIPAANISVAAKNTAASQDRIVAKAEPREPMKNGAQPWIVRVWQVPVVVSLHYATDSTQQMDSAVNLMLQAMNTLPDAGGIAIATAAKVTEMNDTAEGEYSIEEDKRVFSKRFLFISYNM